MRNLLEHPLWTHVPGAALLVTVVVTFWRAWPFPDPAPVHFGGDHHPDRWGAPWEIPLIVIGVSVVALGVSVAVDELWARHERKKRFNWFAPLDEAFIGLMTATSIQYVDALDGTPYVFRHSWALVLGLIFVPMLCAVWVETLRPYGPSAWPTAVREDTSRLEHEVSSRQQSGQPWAYWESQNPRYVKWYMPVFGLGLIALGVTSWSDKWWAAMLALLGGAVVLLVVSGGFRSRVTPNEFRLRAGYLGIPLLKLGLDEITEVTTHEFSPLADFGGYGIRRNREMSAFFLQGTTGVKLATTAGKKYLIGSDHPERLAAVLRAATAFSSK
jgi:hypothetical protein